MRLSYGPPDKNLARELKQVNFDACSVEVALNEANFLPADFPRQALADICTSLAGLEMGTAENSRPALEYARNKIPEIRRAFFYIEEEESDASESDTETPRLYRGMSLDRHLNTLIGSVTTALDEYRVQAQQRFDDEVRGEETIVLQSSQELSGPAESASEVIAASDFAYTTLRQKKIDETERGEVLARRLKDSSNLALAARSQLHGGRIVRRWFEGISDAIRVLPDLIGKAGRAIRVGSDVADVLADWWSKTEHKVLKVTIDQIREFGGALENIGEMLSRRQSQKLTPLEMLDTQRNPDEVEAEKEVTRLMKAGIEVPVKLAKIARRLSFSSSTPKIRKIPRWQDIMLCENLVSLETFSTDFQLDLHGNFLVSLDNLQELLLPLQNRSDLSPLAELTNLTSLRLDAHNATDISPLKKLTGLTRLGLSANHLDDISPIKELTDLTSLSLTANRLTDVSALEELTNLTSLSLQTIGSTSVPPLARLTNLTSLSLSANNLSDISPLAELTNLEALSLTTSKLTDISSLDRLTRLTSLSIQTPNLADISPLRKLTNLSTLHLATSKSTHITPLKELIGLTSLSLQTTNVIDISPLENLPNLTALHLTANKLVDISPLGKLTNITSLSLQTIKVTDSSPLEALVNLTSLTISAIGAGRRFSKLFELPRLTRLSLNLTKSEGQWDWLAAVSEDSKVETLGLGTGGQIDLEQLSPMKNLTTLRLSSIDILNGAALPEVKIEIRGSSANDKRETDLS